MTSPDALTKPTRLRRWIKGLAIVVSVILIVAAVASVLLERRLRGLIQFANDARDAYEELNQDFTFEPPSTGAFGDSARLEMLVAIRRRAGDQLDPQARQAIESGLQAQSLDTLQMIRKSMSLDKVVQAVIGEHLAALREHNMSADEYCWILGLAVRDAMANPEQYPSGRTYWTLLEDLERLSQSADSQAEQLDPKDFFKALDRHYAGHRMAHGWMIDALQTDQPSDCVLDLAVVASRWAPPADQLAQRLKD